MVNKIHELQALTAVDNASVIAITETHLNEDIASSELFTRDYITFRKDRNRHGGGVLLAVHKNLQPTLIPSSFDVELIAVSTSIMALKIIFVCIYRPPNTSSEGHASLCQAIEKICSSASKVIFMGDFNMSSINWSTYTGKSQSELSFLDTVLDCNLEQLVSFPTRPNENGGTLIDLLLTNCPNLIKDIYSSPGLSDHVIIQALLEVTGAQHLIQEEPRFCYSKSNFTAISEFLSLSLHGSHHENVQTYWEAITQTAITAMNNYTPMIRPPSRNSLPWVTKQLRQKIKQRQRLYIRAKLRQTEEAWQLFKDVRSEIKHSLRQHHTEYLEHAVSNLSDHRRSFFKAINKKASRSSSTFPTLEYGSVVATTSTEKADLLASSFQLFFQEEKFPLPHPLPPRAPQIEDIRVTSMGVLKLLTDLKPHKSMGPDGFHPVILKNCAAALAMPLAELFQISIDSGQIPTDWKRANVAPIFKSGKRSSPENYRPVSLTAVLCKILEHIVATNIYDHLECYNLLSDAQHGFRKGFSTETQLLNCIENWTKMLETSSQVDIIFLDFRKAFDSVPIERLLSKLSSYGIQGNLLNWIRDFLVDRKFRVAVDGQFSDWFPAASGVPQGSVLGPLLFIIYLNDIGDGISSYIAVYADDIVLYRAIRTHEDSVKLQEDLNSIALWSNIWQLPLNPKKCTLLRVHKTRIPLIPTNYKIEGTEVTAVTHQKYLGITINEDMSWDMHTTLVTAKAASQLGFLKRHLATCSQSTKSLAVQSFVQPILDYCASVWSPHTAGQTHRLEMIQRRAARFVTGCAQRASVTNVLQNLKWPTLAARRKKRRIQLFHKIIFNPHKSLLPLKNTLETYISQNRGTNTGVKFTHIRSKSSARQGSFLPFTIREWNKLNDGVRATSSFTGFSKKI